MSKNGHGRGTGYGGSFCWQGRVDRCKGSGELGCREPGRGGLGDAEG